MGLGSVATNTRGRYFVSYRRSPEKRTRQAVRVRDALRDRGIPTWRDIESLPSGPSEPELRNVLRDDNTAGAVMMVVPEVRDSLVIRRVEAPCIFDRHAKNDGFAVKVVLCGVDYGEADGALESPSGFQKLTDWNLHRLTADRVGEAEARAIARTVLRGRLQMIAAHAPSQATSVGVYTRAPEKNLRFDLNFDFTSLYNGREPLPGTFDRIQSGFHDAAAEVLATNMPKRIIGEGFASFATAVLFGAVFSPLAGFDVVWRQKLAGGPAEDWSLGVPATAFPVTTRVVHGDLSSNALLLAIGVNQNIEPPVRAQMDATGLKPRAVVYVEPQGGRLAEGVALTPGDGTAIALQAITALRNLKDELHLPTAEVHVFLAAPLALAVLLGQKLNTFSAVHVYEYEGNSPPYTKILSFNPSGFSYKALVS